ncbi:MAG: hypothetical protein M3455_07205, partial [Actinomycetota bacterium]|nr:hypothetical protein [Actinomycetota bacterium]
MTHGQGLSRRRTARAMVVVLAMVLAGSVMTAAQAGSGGEAQRAAEAEAALYLSRVVTTQEALPLRRCARAADRAGWSGTDLVVATA